MPAVPPPAPGDPWSTLRALGAALQTLGVGGTRPLGELLAAHPDAARVLTDALLELSADAPAPEPVGSAGDTAAHLGPYRIEKELGRGGQAVVFAAVDQRLGRRVALKVLRSDVFFSQIVESRFRAEAMLTSRLDHPGICPIYEIGTDGDQLFLAMRHVDGKTLAAHIATAKGRVAPGHPFALDLGATLDADDSAARRLRPWLATLRLLESAAQALHAAHQAGITHRDFKPGNLMVQRDGTGVVLDFGLAADAQRDGAALTRTGEVFGTPAYMAPEQCRDAKTADARSDVFALGATLFEALTGERAFVGATPELVIRRILSGRVPDPCRLQPALPRELRTIVGKALDPDPARRYATAAAFADDLQRVRQSRPILAEPPSMLLVAQRWVQRNPWLTAALLATILGGTISSLSLLQASRRSRELDHLSLAQTLTDLRTAYRSLLPIPEDTARVRAWQQAANEMLARRDDVAAAVANLRATAQPADVAALAHARASHPATAELERLQAIDNSLATGAGPPAALAAQRALAGERAAQRTRLLAELAAVQQFRFADAERQRLHDALTNWLADADAFAGADGPLASIERELAALTDTNGATWPQAIASIAELPQYHGLKLQPQVGLQPLRHDPATGLWEFVHLRSGTPPAVHADGPLSMTAESGIVLVLLPGGTFTAGSQASNPAAANWYGGKIRPIDDYLLEVTVGPFFLATHETTQAQWRRLGGGTPSVHRTALANPDVHPVENLTWARAREILQRSGLTMPTDLQWEYAARNSIPVADTGDTDPWLLTENLFDASAAQARLNGFPPMRKQPDGWPWHAPVGSFLPGPLGLYDLFGNVQEWCLDCDTHPTRDLVRVDDGLWLSPPSDKHMLRGASFLNGPGSANFTTSRAPYLDYGHTFGVRAARALDR
ncbi:MAG: SUMF1/EgtB/PvdO family nonheme iron enzyme [Planctomycetes bacterium]|nr:SUMF1/EgtB/PvdO family nonheme iron enzyme [Planctomycetota bacterium]